VGQQTYAWKRSTWSANAKLWRSAGRTIYGTQKLHHSPASAQYWTSTHVAGTLSLATLLGSPKTHQLTKHSGVTSTYLLDTFLIKVGGVVRDAQATDGLTRSAGTTTTYHQLICGGNPECEVIRGWRYGPCRQRVNDETYGTIQNSSKKTASNSLKCKVTNAITRAAVQNLDSQIWKSWISKSPYPPSWTCILPTFLYGSECWAVTKRDVLKIDGVCVSCWESNGTTICGMMMWDGKQSNHIFRVLFKHGVSLCLATLRECQTNQMPSRS